MLTDEERRIKDKLDFFMESNIEIHVSLKDRTFLNGRLIKIVREYPRPVYWLEERLIGEVFLFLGDINDVKVFENKKEVEDGDQKSII